MKPATRTIDIIIPVYRGYELTRRCIGSVLAGRLRSESHVVLIDDASPEAAIRAYLDEIGADERVTLIRNTRNLGFVASVNRGMQVHPDRDVVLLNSDTEVANDWLDRLRDCVYSEDHIATATPFSNNATICSYPLFCRDNPMPHGLDVAALDRVFRDTNRGRRVELPTAVGSCMFIRRPALDAAGLFDEAAFGRGYGEEADFCCRASALGWRHMLCADTFVFHAGGASFGPDKLALSEAAQAVIRARHPDYQQKVDRHLMLDPAADLRRAVELEIESRRRRGLEMPIAARRPAPAAVGARFTQLHLIHALGGGVERWCRDFCAADRRRRNLVLRPICRDRQTSVGLMLHDGDDLATPIEIYPLGSPIVATAVRHPDYRAVLDRVVAAHGVDALLVSSLIGHSVDALRTGLPTVLVQHDYYPFCPAINLHFRGLCPDCSPERLSHCARENHDFNLFRDHPPEARLAVRDAVLEAIAAGPVSVVQPSHCVAHHLRRIAPMLAETPIVTIPHGQDDVVQGGEAVAAPHTGPFRIVVLGMLSVSKGVRLLQGLVPQLPSRIELHLLGCGPLGEVFADDPRVRLLPRYEASGLHAHLQRIRPHLGLLLSIWPETYSYTLTELQAAGIATLATRVGAFAERIRDGETGFLVEPAPAALRDKLLSLSTDPAALARVRSNLASLPGRGRAQMVADYHRLLPDSGMRSRPSSPTGAPPPFGPTSAVGRQMIDLQESWQGHQREQDAHAATKLRLRDMQTIVHGLRRQLAQHHDARRAAEARSELLTTRLAEVHASTSWRMTTPVRWLGRHARRLRTLSRWLTAITGDRARLVMAATALLAGWRAGGYRGWRLELALMAAPPPPSPPPGPHDEGGKSTPVQQAFVEWCRSRDAARDDHVRQLASLPRQPLISILVPVFDADEPVLTALIESIRAQYYQNWELCLADDASTRPHVRRVLARHAGMDPRIRVSFTATNGGVSQASNRALAMASGEFCLLADHDDLVEPHALLRFAESVCGDDPDIVYSDEVLVGPDGIHAEHFALRPAFSPEYLRSHPYIVHLVGFRTELLRRLGGWNESLRISQDYDLILRASEHARRIVHLPEILYRWRIHPGSAGHARMREVMETSRGVIERHIARCGETAAVSAGPSFNFFETRYPPPAGARVAIVVPTRNQARIVAACIDSIEATCADVEARIFLVDHASDEADALAYFRSLGDRVCCLRQGGDFNFARLNNQAVAAVPKEFDYLLFLNNDVEAIEPGWLGKMLELAARPDVGAVGAALLYPDGGTLQHAGVVVAACGIAENLGRFRKTGGANVDQGYMGSLIASREVSAVTAACLLMRREVFAEIGGFDERLAVGYGDVDLCLRLRERAYRVVLCPHARLLHHESYSRGRSGEGDPHPGDTAVFRQRWDAYFHSGDPYFSPNLSPNSPNWQIRRPLQVRSNPLRRIWERGDGNRGRLRFS
ncbi:MAG: glycosyltransferase [Rhodocyclaceae bacterium]|nr:glycosyltransferase [Rhodocyclaceae bacterium]